MDLIFGMKEFTILLLGVIFVTLAAGSVQSIYADHILKDGKGIFKDQDQQNFAETTDSNSKYQIHLQVEIRNAQDQLISIAETSQGNYIPERITDLLFEKLGKKEIVTIDNIKYEKVQYTFSPTLEQRMVKLYPIFEEIPLNYVVDEEAEELKKDIRDYYRWVIHYCATVKGHVYTCMPVFQTFNVLELVTQTDVVTHQWTILRELN